MIHPSNMIHIDEEVTETETGHQWPPDDLFNRDEWLEQATNGSKVSKRWLAQSILEKKFFCGKKVFLDTLAAVNIGYDKCPILETC